MLVDFAVLNPPYDSCERRYDGPSPQLSPGGEGVKMLVDFAVLNPPYDSCEHRYDGPSPQLSPGGEGVVCGMVGL